MNKWLATGIAGAVAVAGLLSWVGSIAGDNARTKEKLETLEKRVAEDRRTYQREQSEIKTDVKAIASDVQLILRKMDVIDSRRIDSERRR